MKEAETERLALAIVGRASSYTYELLRNNRDMMITVQCGVLEFLLLLTEATLYNLEIQHQHKQTLILSLKRKKISSYG